MAQFPSYYTFPILDNNGNATTTVVDMADMFVRKEDFLTAGLYAWGGANTLNGQLGDGTVVPKSSPIQVGSLTNWRLIAGGWYTTAAIKTDGTLWTWGQNTNGALGLSDLVHRSSPVQVGSLTNWRLVTAGRYVMAAIKTDGTLWIWHGGASAGNGASGVGVALLSSPVQVGSSTNWRVVSVWGDHTTAITNNGALWTWGYNNQGQLGQGNTTHLSSPVQVGSLTNWRQIASGNFHTAAVKTDGTLWTWGRNSTGQLGQGTITHLSSPVQVGSLNNWKLVACGRYHTVSIKTDGTLWTWGRNDSGGALGLGDIVHRSSPVQVGSLTNWRQAACGLSFTMITKTDGTLWGMGNNTYGQLGQNTFSTPRSSPVQVGSLTSWRLVTAGTYNTTAISSPDLP
jgi:alpha-tubulin suppressor-like RCC1 family protein